MGAGLRKDDAEFSGLSPPPYQLEVSLKRLIC
jgi:hypothetical protein